MKLLENIFRSVNIALVNELAQLCDRIGVDVWEVVDAAATKPFGFMSFKPGPGLGGHCLPVDPFYLSWKAREFDFYTEFIELAGKVNENMPFFCFQKIGRALNDHERPFKGSRVHLLGVSYKENVGDLRESPALKLIELLRDERGRDRLHRSARADAPRVRPRVGGARRGRRRRLTASSSSPRMMESTTRISPNRARLVVDLRNATGVDGNVGGKVWKL